MSKRSKRYIALREQVDQQSRLTTSEAFVKIADFGKCKFDESVDVAVRLGVNPRHADQMVRGACSLPHGTGRGVRVLVFADGEAARLASEAGADFVGAQELIDKVKDGWLEFDKAVATRAMMPKVARFLGRILGPRGLMPNPKIGTVVDDAKVADTVGSLKKGKIDFRVDKNGIIHTSIGRCSMTSEQLEENFCMLVATLRRLKPASAKGLYFRSITVSSTMGPGIKIDVYDAQRASERF